MHQAENQASPDMDGVRAALELGAAPLDTSFGMAAPDGARVPAVKGVRLHDVWHTVATMQHDNALALWGDEMFANTVIAAR